MRISEGIKLYPFFPFWGHRISVIRPACQQVNKLKQLKAFKNNFLLKNHFLGIKDTFAYKCICLKIEIIYDALTLWTFALLVTVSLKLLFPARSRFR